MMGVSLCWCAIGVPLESFGEMDGVKGVWMMVGSIRFKSGCLWAAYLWMTLIF